MKVRYSPQRSDVQIAYGFPAPDVVDVQLVRGGVTYGEAFDFSDVPDGEAEAIEPETLPVCPIVEARRENGVLYLTLLKPHGPNAPASERFPDQAYQEVGPGGQDPVAEEG